MLQSINQWMEHPYRFLLWLWGGKTTVSSMEMPLSIFGFLLRIFYQIHSTSSRLGHSPISYLGITPPRNTLARRSWPHHLDLLGVYSTLALQLPFNTFHSHAQVIDIFHVFKSMLWKMMPLRHRCSVWQMLPLTQSQRFNVRRRKFALYYVSRSLGTNYLQKPKKWPRWELLEGCQQTTQGCKRAGGLTTQNLLEARAGAWNQTPYH